MEKHFERKSTAETTNELEILSMVKKIQHQLVFLEKKIDTLMESSQAPRKPYGEKRYPRPASTSRGPSQRSWSPERGNGRPSGDRDRGQSRGGYDRPSSDRGPSAREGSSGRGGSYERSQSDQGRGFAFKKSRPAQRKY